MGDKVFNETYFNQDYKLQAIWLGLDWWFISFMPLIMYAAGGWKHNWSGGMWHAWGVVRWGQGTTFWVLGIFWLLAYIKGWERHWQKIYYRAIAWCTGFSWLFAVWYMIAFIVGSAQEKNGWGILYWLLNWIFLGGLQTLAWFVLQGRAVKFYKWDQQEWWNYDPEDVPGTWPKQLGEFVDY